MRPAAQQQAASAPAPQNLPPATPVSGRQMIYGQENQLAGFQQVKLGSFSLKEMQQPAAPAAQPAQPATKAPSAVVKTLPPERPKSSPKIDSPLQHYNLEDLNRTLITPSKKPSTTTPSAKSKTSFKPLPAGQEPEPNYVLRTVLVVVLFGALAAVQLIFFPPQKDDADVAVAPPPPPPPPIPLAKPPPPPPQAAAQGTHARTRAVRGSQGTSLRQGKDGRVHGSSRPAVSRCGNIFSAAQDGSQ